MPSHTSHRRNIAHPRKKGQARGQRCRHRRRRSSCADGLHHIRQLVPDDSCSGRNCDRRSRQRLHVVQLADAAGQPGHQRPGRLPRRLVRHGFPVHRQQLQDRPRRQVRQVREGQRQPADRQVHAQQGRQVVRRTARHSGRHGPRLGDPVRVLRLGHDRPEQRQGHQGHSVLPVRGQHRRPRPDRVPDDR